MKKRILVIEDEGEMNFRPAISIYSIFNASVDSEKERINVMEENLNDKISTETQSLGKSNVNFQNTKALFDLTSPFSTTFNKRQAIFHFSQTPPGQEDIKGFIRNYFQSLDASEREKKYYRELEYLINGWGTL